MEWTVVEIAPTSGKNVAFVSIGRGRLEFSAAACDLVGDKGQYKFARLFTGKEKGKTSVAVKFLQEAESNTIAIQRKKQKDGSSINGMTVVNKGVISKLFGKNGDNDGMVRYGVEKIGDDMLKILE